MNAPKDTAPSRIELPVYERGDVVANPDGILATIINASDANYAYVTEEGQTGWMDKNDPWLRWSEKVNRPTSQQQAAPVRSVDGALARMEGLITIGEPPYLGFSADMMHLTAYIADLEARPSAVPTAGVHELAVALKQACGTLIYIAAQGKANHPGFTIVAKMNAESAVKKIDDALAQSQST